MDEGYVKYSAAHTQTEARIVPGWAELNQARTALHGLGLIGADSAGVGFGNLSIRFAEDRFLISGTATGARAVLGPEDYCVVRSFDIEKNRLVSEGPIRASSESMTHGSLYRHCPEVNCVIHIHSRAIFDGMAADGFPSSPESARYGTPEIAMGVAEAAGGNQGRIVMLGHDGGIVCYGPTVSVTLSLTLDLHEKYGGN